MRKGGMAAIMLPALLLAASFGVTSAAQQSKTPKKPVAPTQSKASVKITAPRQGAEVARESLVEGKVSNPKPNDHVYVLVHPLRAKSWWVQRIPGPANKDGSWQALCFFGEAAVGLNEQYQIVAIATNQSFKEGDELPDVPSGVTRSEVVTVKRTR